LAVAGPLAFAGDFPALPVARPAPETSQEAAFLSENEAAMNEMMTDMEIKPTGDIDRDFVNLMAPHHQGAIEMAQAVLRYGRNEQIRRLAQEIIVTQQQEIAAMRLAIGDPLPASVASPTQIGGPLAADQTHGAATGTSTSVSHPHMHPK
jgi:hypothetical protein